MCVQPKKWKVEPELVQSVTEQISLAMSEGWLLVYTDGSSKRINSRTLPKGGGGGHAPSSDFSVEVWVSEPLDEEERQSNNAAKLVASIEALRLFESRLFKVCVRTDSESVFLLRVQGTPGQRGPVGGIVGLIVEHEWQGHIGLEGN